MKDKMQKWARKVGTGRNKSSNKAHQVFDFLENLLETQGNALPTKEDIFELPPNTKFNHWISYTVEQELNRTKQFCCEYSYFSNLWAKDYPNLIIPPNPRWVHSFATHLISSVGQV